MSISLILRQTIRQALELVGGATESIFPEVEALLLSDTDYQEALEYVAARKNMDRYRSMMDFLFCELFPEWQHHCFRYYEDKGPMLKDQLTVKELLEYNSKLLRALEVALEIFKSHTPGAISWKSYRNEVMTALSVAS